MHEGRRAQGQASNQGSESDFIVAVELFWWMESTWGAGNLMPAVEHLQPFFACPCMPRWMNRSSVTFGMWRTWTNLRTSLNWADVPNACLTLLWIISRAFKTDPGASANGTVLASPPTYYHVALANFRMPIDCNILYRVLQLKKLSWDRVFISWRSRTHYCEKNNWSTKRRDLYVFAMH